VWVMASISGKLRGKVVGGFGRFREALLEVRVGRSHSSQVCSAPS
jgi:hypothetical protein